MCLALPAIDADQPGIHFDHTFFKGSMPIVEEIPEPQPIIVTKYKIAHYI